MGKLFYSNLGRVLSKEEKAYLPYARAGSPRSVIVFGKWYPSISDAARATGNSKQTIDGWLHSKKSTRAQYA